MALIRWQPFSEIEHLRRQMDTMFDHLTGFGDVDVYDKGNWQPAVELVDSDEALTLKAEIPGIEPKDLDISVSRNSVTISGEHRYEEEKEEKDYYRSEFRYGKFERTIGLPVEIQNNKVEAEFNNGILTLTLPKVEEAKAKVVKVKLPEGTTKES